MKPGDLIRLNRQLLLKQSKSNPYRLKVGKPAALGHGVFCGSKATITVQPRAYGQTTREEHRRSSPFLGRFAFLMFVVAVSIAIVGTERVNHRRKEYQLATELRKQEESAHRSERLNAALVAQMKRLIMHSPALGDYSVQPAAARHPTLTNRTVSARL